MIAPYDEVWDAKIQAASHAIILQFPEETLDSAASKARITLLMAKSIDAYDKAVDDETKKEET